MTNIPFKVREIKTKAIVLTESGRQITFNASPFGPGNYSEIGKQIDEAGLLRPSLRDLVSLVYSAKQNPHNKNAKQVLDIFNEYWFWGFNNIMPVMDIRMNANSPKESSAILYLICEDGAEKLAKILEPGEPDNYSSLHLCLHLMVVGEYERLRDIDRHLLDASKSEPLRAVSLGYGRLPWFHLGGAENQGYAFGLMKD